MHIARTVALVIALSAVGCMPAPPRQVEGPAPLPSPDRDGYYTVRFPELKRGEARTRILANGRDHHTQCHASPHFLSGAIDPRPQDMDDLERLATCLNDPEVRDLDIDLIGRADAHGNTQANRALGLARAKRVRDILTSHGVDPERMRVKTTGAAGALGVLGQYSDGYDRRVDAVLTGQTHSPRGRRDGLALVTGRR